MGNPSEHDLRAFLLGRLSPDAAAEVETEMMTADATFAAIEDAEDELIDDFLDDGLTAEETVAFEEYSRRRPGMLERIQFRKALFQALKRNAMSAPNRNRSSARKRWAMLWIPGAMLAAGVALLAFVLLYRGKSPATLSAKNAPAAAAPQITGPAPSRPAKNPENVAVAEVFLPQMAARGTAQPKPIELHTGAATTIRLELEPPSNTLEGSGVWTVAITDAHGTAVEQKGLHAQHFGGITFVSMDIDSSALGAGPYGVRLSRTAGPAVSSHWTLRVTP